MDFLSSQQYLVSVPTHCFNIFASIQQFTNRLIWSTLWATESNKLFWGFQIRKLKGQLEEKQKNGKMETIHSENEVLENGTDMHMIDLQSKLHFHLKNKLLCTECNIAV